MSPFRYRDEESSSSTLFLSAAAGALAGFAVGVLVTQRMGGVAGITARLRERFGQALGDSESDELEGGEQQYADDYRHAEAFSHTDDLHELDEFDEQVARDEDADVELEERVLEAFRNDPLLSERAIDIGAIGGGIIELSGWVDADEEAELAVVLAGGVPGVETVVNRIAIGEEEAMFEDNARRVEEGDPALTEARWEGQQVGTGKRRQGTSSEFDRHADPKPELEDRWQNEQEAVRLAAEETDGLAERRKSTKKTAKGDRTGGAPVAPTGVPKADHVADPEAARDPTRAD